MWLLEFEPMLRNETSRCIKQGHTPLNLPKAPAAAVTVMTTVTVRPLISADQRLL
jgi:hypothetical protein